MVRAVTKRFIAFVQQEDGLTTVEYAIAGTLVGLAVVTAFTNLGTAVATQVNAIITAM